MIAIIFLLLFLNFAISWFNAWSCGRSWNEAKLAGGFARFMVWMGAIMSACGFTWCYLIVLAVVGNMIPYGQDPVTGEPGLLVPHEAVIASFELGYLVIIFPVLGSGLAITMQSWAGFYRERTFGSGALAGYNTLAQLHNMVEAARAVPTFANHLGKLFSGNGDGRGKLALAAVVLVVIALIGGILTTASIIMASARAQAESTRIRYGGLEPAPA